MAPVMSDQEKSHFRPPASNKAFKGKSSLRGKISKKHAVRKVATSTPGTASMRDDGNTLGPGSKADIWVYFKHEATAESQGGGGQTIAAQFQGIIAPPSHTCKHATD